VSLGTQLKAEGNCLYELDHYSAAVELYSSAIELGVCVLERRDTLMAQQRLSTVFANRAACFIKMVFNTLCTYAAVQLHLIMHQTIGLTGCMRPPTLYIHPLV